MERCGEPGAVRRVRDRIAQVHRVRRPRKGELDVRDGGAAAAVGRREHLASAWIRCCRWCRRGACSSCASDAYQSYERGQHHARGEASCEHGPPPSMDSMNRGDLDVMTFPAFTRSCNTGMPVLTMKNLMIL